MADTQSELNFNCTDVMGTKQIPLCGDVQALGEPLACSGLASCTFLDVYVQSLQFQLYTRYRGI